MPWRWTGKNAMMPLLKPNTKYFKWLILQQLLNFSEKFINQFIKCFQISNLVHEVMINEINRFLYILSYDMVLINSFRKRFFILLSNVNAASLHFLLLLNGGFKHNVCFVHNVRYKTTKYTQSNAMHICWWYGGNGRGMALLHS